MISVYDSAFQSRIHITIRYPALDVAARKLVWKNFLSFLPGRPQLLEAEMEALAEQNMNGREIKNVVKAAQLLASGEKKALAMENITTVLQVMHGRSLDIKNLDKMSVWRMKIEEIKNRCNAIEKELLANVVDPGMYLHCIW